MNPSDQYLAGLFDGEGSMSISVRHQPRKAPIYSLNVSIANTHRPILDWCRQVFGGCVTGKTLTAWGKRPCWSWSIGARKAARFLRHVEPYAIIKRDQIAIALMFQDRLDSNFREHGRKRHMVSRWNPGIVTPQSELDERERLRVCLREAKSA